MRAQLTDDEWLREEALLLLDGHPDVRDLFIDLTDQGDLRMRTDPRSNTLKWDTRKKPRPCGPFTMPSLNAAANRGRKSLPAARSLTCADKLRESPHCQPLALV